MPLNARPDDWRPNPGPQTRFLASSASEGLYGGAAGGGKSAALIAAPLRWVTHPKFRALILRRETTQLTNLLDKARELYPRAFPGARFNEQKKTWFFPSGATVRFNHCEHEKDAAIYDGDEFQYVAFDELTHFTQKQFVAISARVRSAAQGLPRFVRASTNPGGYGHEWVFRRWGPWLDPAFEAAGIAPRRDAETGRLLPPARPGETLWYVPTNDGERWVPQGTPGARSRVFIPARLADNPRLLDADPEYATALMGLDPVRRAQLLDGNWLIKPSAGLYFRRGWFEVVGAAPIEATRVRYWDRAASPDGDYTVGVKLARTRDKLLFVEDVVRFRGRPLEVMAAIKNTAKLDGQRVTIGIEQDPGQAGVVEADAYVRELQGFTVRKVRPTGDKVSRAQPVSAQVEAGNVKLVQGAWCEPFIQELEGFPDSDHDDQVDAFSGAFGLVVGAVSPTLTEKKATELKSVLPKPRM